MTNKKAVFCTSMRSKASHQWQHVEHGWLALSIRGYKQQSSSTSMKGRLASVEAQVLAKSARDSGDVVERICCFWSGTKKNRELMKKLIRILYFLVKHHMPHTTTLTYYCFKLKMSSWKLEIDVSLKGAGLFGGVSLHPLCRWNPAMQALGVHHHTQDMCWYMCQESGRCEEWRGLN